MFGPETLSLHDVPRIMIESAKDAEERPGRVYEWVADVWLRWQFDEIEFRLYIVVKDMLPVMIDGFPAYDEKKPTFGSMHKFRIF